MQRLERILVIVDRRMQLSPAWHRGVALARRAAATLQLCLLDHEPLIDASAEAVHPDVLQLAKAQFVGERQRWLAQQGAALTDQGLRVDSEVRWAPLLHKALLDRVLEHRPDLVIMDAGHNGGHAPRLFAPQDWKAVRLCPAPLMLVRPQSGPLPTHIAAAVDTAGDPAITAPLNDSIVAAVRQLGLFADAAVDLIHAFPLRPPSRSGDGSLEAAYEELRQTDADTFRAFAARHQFAPEHQHLLTGDPASALTELAARGSFDLLAVGSQYRTAFDRFLLGSTAETVLAQAACDVLIVKPPQFAEELRKHVDIDALRRRQALLQVAAA